MMQNQDPITENNITILMKEKNNAIYMRYVEEFYFTYDWIIHYVSRVTKVLSCNETITVLK